jgi:hypothetical protein
MDDDEVRLSNSLSAVRRSDTANNEGENSMDAFFVDCRTVRMTFVKIDESNESWVEVCRRSSKIKSSLRKAKYESDGG